MKTFAEVISLFEGAGIDVREAYWAGYAGTDWEERAMEQQIASNHKRADGAHVADFVIETPDGAHHRVAEVHFVETFVSGDDGPVAAGRQIVVVVD